MGKHKKTCPIQSHSSRRCSKQPRKKYTTQLETKSFTGNKEYTYHLKTSEKTPGIITAEDWIAFSQLINSNTFTQYKGIV